MYFTLAGLQYMLFAPIFEGGLVDTYIDVLLDCKAPCLMETIDADFTVTSSSTTYNRILTRLREEEANKYQHALDHIQPSIPQLIYGLSEPDWILKVQAYNILERQLQTKRHFEQFKIFAKHRGWPIEVNNVHAIVPKTNSMTNSMHQSASLWVTTKQYLEVSRVFKGTNDEAEFWRNCPDNQAADDTIFDVYKKKVQHVLSHWKYFVCEEDYEIIKSEQKRSKIQRHALLRCMTFENAKMKDIRHVKQLLSSDSGMSFSYDMQSKLIADATEVAAILGIQSLVHDCGIPSEWIERMKREVLKKHGLDKYRQSSF
eukprot:g2531.t1